MNYTLNQLRIFYTVAETESVTKAAEELHLTQPAVSIQLKNFQDQFDIPLTEVVGRKLYITDFGKEVAAAAEQILNQVHAINYRTMAFKGQLTGRLKISIVSTGKYVMPYFLSDFVQRNPGVELQMDVTNKNKVLESLANNEIDFALVSVLPTSLNIKKLDLLQNKLFLVGPKSPKRKKAVNAQTVFQELPLIYRESGSGTRQTMERFIEKNQISVQKKLVLATNEAVKQAILAGLGYSIMPLIGIRNELQNGELEIVQMKGLPIKTTWSLIWPADKRHSPVASAYADFLRKEKSRIASERFNWYENYR